MGNPISKAAVAAEVAITGRRFCSDCRVSQPVAIGNAALGRWLVSANGLTRRWVCQTCRERRDADRKPSPQR
jgi:hypothetical protein